MADSLLPGRGGVAAIGHEQGLRAIGPGGVNGDLRIGAVASLIGHQVSRLGYAHAGDAPNGVV
jgi:hypothetical protein